MPSWKFHVSRSVSDKEKAREIHELMDIDGLHLYSHQRWRSLTHNILPALVIGYSVNGSKGAADAMRHITDDQLFNAMFRKKSTEPETEE